MMYRYRKRVVFLLILFIIFAPFSFSEIVYADENSDRLEHDLVSHYKGAVSLLAEMTGYTELSGRCGYLVGCELKIAGLFDSYHGPDGNYAYEYYKAAKPKSGESVTIFPGKHMNGTYTIKGICDMLDEANSSGENTYAVFCFDKGNQSSDGQKFGHVLLVYAVYDGKVYWGDIDGYFVDTINNFSEMYAEYSSIYRFDGAIVYGYKETVEARGGKLLRFEHARRVINDAVPDGGVWTYAKPSCDSEKEKYWKSGECIDTVAVYEDDTGCKWYELADHTFIEATVEHNGTGVENSLFAESTASYGAIGIIYSDAVEGTPQGKIKPGRYFKLLGTIYSTDSIMDAIGYIYRMDGSIAMQSEPMNITDHVTAIDIQNSNINRSLHLRLLEAGEVYRYEVVVYTQSGSATVIESVFGIGVEPNVH